MIPITKRHTCVPAKKGERFTTVFDNQPTVFIKVYEGEHSRTKDNKIIGVLQLTNLPLAPKGTPIIEINLDVCSALDVIVTAREAKSGQSVSLNINFHLGEQFPVFSDPYTANCGIQPLINGSPPQPKSPTSNQNVPAAQTEPTTPAPTFDQRPNAFNFSTPTFPTPSPFAQPAPVNPQANTFDFRSPSSFGPFTPDQNAHGVPPQPPPPPPPTQPPLVQPNAYSNGGTSTEERLRIMEDRYDLLEAKHAALEAKVRVLEIALASRR